MTGAIEQVVAALNAAGVRYVIVGGVAVVLHGHLRVTADLDLVVQLARANVLEAMRALSQLGYRPRAPVAAEQFADVALRESWLRENGLTVFGLWSEVHPGLESTCSSPSRSTSTRYTTAQLGCRSIPRRQSSSPSLI